MMGENKFEIGDKVRKTSGYSFFGIVVSVFEKLNGETRYVVECTVNGVEGILHIYNASNLELDE